MTRAGILVGKILGTFVALVVGGVVAYEAGWVVAPRLVVLPSMRVVEAVETGVDVSVEVVEKARSRFVTAERFGLPPDLAQDAALLDIALAESVGRTAYERADDLDRARTSLRESLAARPLDGLGWMRLAYVEFRINNSSMSPAMMEALRLSTRLADYDPGILLKRLHLWIAVLDDLEDGDRAMLRRQIALSFTEDPAGVASLAFTYRKTFAVRALLDETTIEKEEIDLYLPVPLKAKEPRR